MRFLRGREAGAKEARGARGGSSTGKGGWGVRGRRGGRSPCRPLSRPGSSVSPAAPPQSTRQTLSPLFLGLSGPVAPQKERGLWAPRHQPCPPSPGSGSPGLREQAREGLVVAPATLFSVHSPGGPVRARGSAMGAAEGARERAWVCTLSSSRPARQEVSPHPQPGPWRGPTSWKAVRHLSRPRKPG